jgi:hypothetical protein
MWSELRTAAADVPLPASTFQIRLGTFSKHSALELSKRTEHLHSRGQRHYRHLVQTAFARSHSRAKTGNPFENKNLILQLNNM